MSGLKRKPMLKQHDWMSYTKRTFIYPAKEKVILNMVSSYFSSHLLYLPLHCDLTMTLQFMA